MNTETKYPFSKLGTNHTPFKVVHVAKSLELVNDMNMPIANFEIDGVPQAICVGNVHRFCHIANNYADLVVALEACKRAVENNNLPPSARLELVRDYATPVLNRAKGAQ